MDVTTTELKHDPGSLAGVTLDEGIPLKKVTLIERISESHRRERIAMPSPPSLFVVQRTRKVLHTGDQARNKNLNVIRRHYKFGRRRRQEKQMYKRAMREKARVKYEQDGRQKARVKCVQVRREKARAKYEQEGRSMYKEKGREKRREEREEKARVKYLTESRDRGRVEYEQKAVRKLGSSSSPSGCFEPSAKHYAASKVEK